MNDREFLLGMAEWHRARAAEALALARKYKKRKRGYAAANATLELHERAWLGLGRIAAVMPARIPNFFRDRIAQERVLCNAPVDNFGQFALCTRTRGHEGEHRCISIPQAEVRKRA
jgi:hypothetical protein